MELLKGLVDIAPALELLAEESVLYLFMALLVFYLGKKGFGWLSPYNLDEELTTKDNKAVALSFVGYIFGLGLIVKSTVSGTSIAEGGSLLLIVTKDLLDTFLWCAVGVALLLLARIINDKLILPKFNNAKELIEDRNIGTGAVECGGFIASAIIISSVLEGETQGYIWSLLLTGLYFIIGQLAFILYGFLYQRIVNFDLHDEIERDNIAVGVAFGMNLVAEAILIGAYIKYYDSLLGLALWMVVSFIILISLRYLVDKLILPGSTLVHEICKDRNWGAAIIEGTTALAVAFVVSATFF